MEWLNLSAQEYRERFVNKNKPSSKYHNIKTTNNGIVFDSKKESDYFNTLKALELSGKIKDLKLQHRFVLIEPFTDNSGIKERGTSWVADFYYFDIEKDKYIAVDVKSSITRKKPEYIIKRKLFKVKYPHIYFEEVL